MWSSLMSIIAEFSQKTSWTLYIYSFSLFFFFRERLFKSLFTSLFYFSLRKNENRILSKCDIYYIYYLWHWIFANNMCLCLHWLWKCFDKYGIMKLFLPQEWILSILEVLDINHLDKLDSINQFCGFRKKPKVYTTDG